MRSDDPRRITAACFDALAHQYLASYAADSLNGHVLRVRQTRLLELVQDLPPGRILDVGCGPAVLAPELVARGHEYVGIDASRGMIDTARSGLLALERLSFAIAGAEHLPFKHGAFDIVICIGVLDRLPKPERALVEMARVLRPGGLLLASFPNRLSPYAVWRGTVFYPLVGLGKRILLSLRQVAKPEERYLRFHLRLWTPAEAEYSLQAAVGEVIATAYYGFVPLLSPLDQAFPRLAVRLTRRAEIMHRGRLRKLCAGFIVKARKRPL